MKIYVKIALAALITMSPILSIADPLKTPLHKAAADCNKPIYSIFEQDKSAITKKDGDGNIPLHEAAAFGCEQHIEDLLGYGLEYLWGNKWDLGHGISLNQLKSKIESLDYNIYINAQNYKGETALDKAHYFQKPEIEKLLKEYGGKYNIYNELNTIPSQQELDNLSFFYNLFIKIIALKRGANPNSRDSNGMTPLHVLAQNADYTTPDTNFKVLLAYGADINALDNEGYTPYGRTQDPEVAKFFQEHNARYQSGWEQKPKQRQRKPQRRTYLRKGKC